MKTKTLIIIGIIAVFVIAASAFTVVTYYESYQDSSSLFDYKKTEQVTDETFLSKTVQEWQEVSFDDLMNYHEDYGKRDFFGDLGALLIKNEMLLQLQRANITNANDDFAVYQGLVLASLPPHVSFETVVNGTDGNSYRLQGGTFANTVSRVGITNLVFYDTSERLSIDSVIPENQIVQILPNNGNGPRVEPFDLVIDADRHNVVGFENKLGVPIQILGGNDYRNAKWTGPIIIPYGKGMRTFNNTGVFEWSARSLPLPGSDWREGYGNGEINVLSDETDNLPQNIKWKIAQAIIGNSEIPLNGIGTGMDGLYIDFNHAIFEMLPDAEEYYTARSKQLVPFDVPIIIEGPERNDD